MKENGREQPLKVRDASVRGYGLGEPETVPDAVVYRNASVSVAVEVQALMAAQRFVDPSQTLVMPYEVLRNRLFPPVGPDQVRLRSDPENLREFGQDHPHQFVFFEKGDLWRSGTADNCPQKHMSIGRPVRVDARIEERSEYLASLFPRDKK